MATNKRSTPPFFNFLKEGVLLPTRNRKLFAAVFVLATASTTSLLVISNDLTNKLNFDTKDLNSTSLAKIKDLNGTDPRSPNSGHLTKEIQDDTWLMLVAAAYLLLDVTLNSIIEIIVLFAAVATYSGELRTFVALLGKAKAHLKGPLVTLAFVVILEIAYSVLLGVLQGFLIFLIVFKHYSALKYIKSLVRVLNFIFRLYFSFLCSFSVVVAVAEHGCHGASAVLRAWRLTKYKRRRVMLFSVVTGALTTVVSPVRTLAKACAQGNMASGLLLGLLYIILMVVVEVFATLAMTAFYYECKESTDASVTEYVKVSSQELV